MFDWEERAKRAILKILSSEPMSFRELHRRLSTYPDQQAHVGSFTTLQHIVQDLSASKLISIRKGEGIRVTENGAAYLERPTSPIAVFEGAAIPSNEIILLDIDKDGEVKSYQFSRDNYEIRNYGSAGMIVTAKNTTKADWLRHLS